MTDVTLGTQPYFTYETSAERYVKGLMDDASRFRITVQITHGESQKTITLSGSQLRAYTQMAHFPVRKEHFFVLAIKNLIKKIDFLQLNLQLVEECISEDEFEEELEKNEEKYLINLGELGSPEDLHVISDIVEKVDKKLTIDEVSELFSIAPQYLQLQLKF